MEQKITNEYKVKDEAIFNQQHRAIIERFIKAFDNVFEVDFDKDVNITISIKAKEVGSSIVQILNVRVKDQEVRTYDPGQERLFGNGGTTISTITGEET